MLVTDCVETGEVKLDNLFGIEGVFFKALHLI